MAFLGQNSGFYPRIFGAQQLHVEFLRVRPVRSGATARFVANLNASEAEWTPPPQGSETYSAPTFLAAWASGSNAVL
jgi:hypothetical protein